VLCISASAMPAVHCVRWLHHGTRVGVAFQAAQAKRVGDAGRSGGDPIAIGSAKGRLLTVCRIPTARKRV